MNFLILCFMMIAKISGQEKRFIGFLLNLRRMVSKMCFCCGNLFKWIPRNDWFIRIFENRYVLHLMIKECVCILCQFFQKLFSRILRNFCKMLLELWNLFRILF